jgi:hypothetical protein
MQTILTLFNPSPINNGHRAEEKTSARSLLHFRPIDPRHRATPRTPLVASMRSHVTGAGTYRASEVARARLRSW